MKPLIAIFLMFAALACAQERALVDLTTGDVLQVRDISKPGASTANPKRWVPVLRPTAPAFDPATEILVRSTVVAQDRSSVTYQVTKRLLTQAELDAKAAADAEEAAALARRNQLRNVIATLEAGGATDAQVQTALAKVIKEVFGSDLEQ